MTRRDRKKSSSPSGALPDPQGMAAMLAEYLQWMQAANYAERTIRNRKITLGYFISWCKERGVTRPSEVTRSIVERYQRWLYHYRKQNGQPLSIRSQYERLSPVRVFFKWLAKNNYILYNPASELELPRRGKRLPRQVLTASEAEAVLNQTDVFDPLGIRDRAILETLYSTGMRRMELIGLKIYDPDMERGTVMFARAKAVRTG